MYFLHDIISIWNFHLTGKSQFDINTDKAIKIVLYGNEFSRSFFKYFSPNYAKESKKMYLLFQLFSKVTQNYSHYTYAES